MSDVLTYLINLVSMLLFVRIVISWFSIGDDSSFRPIRDVVYRLTNPLLKPIRRILRPVGGLDLPVLAMIFLFQIILIPLVGRL